MMRKRIGIHRATEEALDLIPLLGENPEVEIAAIYDPNARGLRERFPRLAPDLVASLEAKLTDDPEALAADATLYALIDADPEVAFTTRHPEVVERGVQIVSPLTARLLWGYGATSGDHKSELLHALHEIVESYNLTIDADELCTRMLQIARSITGADGGSLMLLDPEAQELRVRVASGIEPELWPKIRVRMGEGIAGRVAADARPVRLRGKADHKSFRIVRERLDIESALCVPLIHQGSVLGVLNLHHRTQPDAFSESDLEFVQQLASLDAQIIARAQEHEAMRSQAMRYRAVREVHEILESASPLQERLTQLCRLVSARAGRGIATLYLYDSAEDELRLAATSLEGGGLGADYRVEMGHGLDGSVARSRQPAFLHGPDGSFAYAALPLLAGGALAGVISVQSSADGPQPSGIEETLQEIATAAADAIAQTQRESHITAHATKVAAINEAGIRLISTTDAAEVLRLGTSSAAMALEADHAVLRVQDEETGRYPIRSYFGAADGSTQKQLFRLDKLASVSAIKRRTPLHVKNLSEHEEFRACGEGFRSLIASPLTREGRVIGTLSVYDKVTPDRFYVGSFGEEDARLFGRFTSYLERALSAALAQSRTQKFHNVDEETGLPNASYLDKRLREEIARGGGRDAALALATCTIENLTEIEHSSDPVHMRRVLQCIVASLGNHLRDFDVLARTGSAEFSILLPDPGYSAGERIFTLARAVADDVAKEERLNEPIRIALAFGYAAYPSEGSGREALLERARVARIRMV